MNINLNLTCESPMQISYAFDSSYGDLLEVYNLKYYFNKNY